MSGSSSPTEPHTRLRLTQDALDRAAQAWAAESTGDLTQQLSQKEAKLKEQSDGASSVADSEERDTLRLAEHTEHLEKLSASSGRASSGRQQLGNGSGSSGSKGQNSGFGEGLNTVEPMNPPQQGHRDTVDDLRERLTDSHSEYFEGLAAMSVLQPTMLGSKAEHERSLQQMAEKMVDLVHRRDAAQETARDAKNAVDILHAQHIVNLESVRKEFLLECQMLQQSKDDLKADNVRIMKEHHNKDASMITLRQRHDDITDELEVAKANEAESEGKLSNLEARMKAMEFNHSRSLENLHELLYSQTKELDLSQLAAVSQDTEDKQPDAVQSIKNLLADSRENQKEMAEKLSNLRLEMFGQQQGHADAMAGKQRELDSANVELKRHRAKSAQRCKVQQPRTSFLTTINESDDQADSDTDTTDSTADSSDLVDAEDLKDFPDVDDDWANSRSTMTKGQVQDLDAKAHRSEELFAREREEHAELREQTAEIKAGQDSKVERLQEDLQEVRAESQHATDRITILSNELSAKTEKHKAESLDFEERILLLQSQLSQKEQENMKLRRLYSKQAQHIQTLTRTVTYYEDQMKGLEIGKEIAREQKSSTALRGTGSSGLPSDSERISPSPQATWQEQVFRRLRCPTRVTGRSSSTTGVLGALHCQTTCWDVLNSVPGVTALLCSLPELTIIEATTKACRLWGSAQLHGAFLLDLVRSPARGAAVQNALTQNLSHDELPGFAIKDLRCMEFTMRADQSFDASVVVVRLPAEPQLDKAAVGVIIIEPLREVSQQPYRHDRRPGAGHRSHDSPHQTDSMSVTSSASVTPSDSISQVAEKIARRRNGGGY